MIGWRKCQANACCRCKDEDECHLNPKNAPALIPPTVEKSGSVAPNSAGIAVPLSRPEKAKEPVKIGAHIITECYNCGAKEPVPNCGVPWC